MVLYNLEKAKKETIKYCRSPLPSTITNITRHLKQNVSGFYPTTPSKKITHRTKKDIIQPLIDDGFIIEYYPGNRAWYKARTILSKYKKKGNPRPRGVKRLYQTNFLYLKETNFPTIKDLPKPHEELNVDLVVMLYSFQKKEDYLWNMLNLLLCSSNEKKQDRLRIFLYKLPIDYDKINMLEKVLEYGEEYSHINFPFEPKVENAEKFLKEITK